MYREKLSNLIYWKDKPNRKPLIVNGARQVGKSWIIREFGKRHFFNNFIELNFEKNLDYHTIFKQNLDPKRILLNIGLITNREIKAGRDLIFFDEIQMCPEALMSLRYFYEEMPELHLIAAGSLLDFSFRNIPFPVGRVEFEILYPMNFNEFLMARNREKIAELIKNEPKSITESIENLIYDELMVYYIVGGMPECVRIFCESNDFSLIGEIQRDLLNSFRQDFKKYSPQVDTDCLMDIIENTTKRIGNQTIYSKLSDRFSNPTIKRGLNLLTTARLLQKIENVSISGLPLVPSGKQFKTSFLDIGLLMSVSRFDYNHAFINKTLLGAFEGKLAEQFVAQQISAQQHELKYWARTESGSNAEVDFIAIYNNSITPIEVKAGMKGSLKSLHYLLKNYPEIGHAIVYGKFKWGNDEKINFRPIYLAGN
ncbi:MAG: ATP-binding protein [Saprospiraceae bacterium]|nr:ATP-binding protein [Saprospiraceae bacterium]